MDSRRSLVILLFVVAVLTIGSLAQTENATVSGRVTDQQGALLGGAQVTITNTDTNVAFQQLTTKEGLYVIPALKPGRYRITVSSPGFRTVNLTDVILNVQDSISQNFRLQLGSVLESITVVADEAKVNTESATVSTVVDRNFADNLPLNGRSFQALIDLTPGVALTSAGNNLDSGQFSVNGQRAAANYWMVDGVSANIGIGAFSPSNGLSGALGAFGAQGGTNSLVSVDAMEEFRVQTSTYAPEFGRTPGGQISIVTRSGHNQFHGTAFEYLRNDVLDSNDWFANHDNLRKPQERQNDFGGTFSGPLHKDRAFFFFSYEGLRLRLPQVQQTTVPDIPARQAALPALMPFLNAYPLPNGIATGDGSAPFNASYSNKSSLDAYSIRLDYKIRSSLNIFGRYNQSPSALDQRGAGTSLSGVLSSSITTRTSTIGGTWLLRPEVTNDLRANYSEADAGSRNLLDAFGGAVPLSSLPFPSPFSASNGSFAYDVFSLTGGLLTVGTNAHNVQHQLNLVDVLSAQAGSHTLKFGIDYRRLSPLFDPALYSQAAFFNDVPSSETGSTAFGVVGSNRAATLLFRNVGLYAQDTFRPISPLSITYGLRLDIDVSPDALHGPNFAAVNPFDFNNLSQLTLAPTGTAPFRTRFNNIAPRVGLALQLSNNPEWTRVLRGGIGVFYDLATQEAGNILAASAYPFANSSFPSGSFPFSSSDAAPPAITPPGGGSGTIAAFDPHLKLPYTIQWNVAFEQQLKRQQTLSASYVGAAGRRLVQTAFIFSPNPNYSAADLIMNRATSDYDALQLQFRRRLAAGLQALASYSYAHSLDDGSAGSYGNTANTGVPGIKPRENRGSSDFDVRHTLSTAVTYDIPTAHVGKLAALVSSWSTENIIQIHSAPPITGIHETEFFTFFKGLSDVRPDVVPGQPFFLYGSSYPGGKALNPNAFTTPPVDSNGQPTRQGNLPRNALRAFPLFQWDFSVHRNFPIHERIALQFRAEMFNVLNHPNFAPPVGGRPSSQFGLSTEMLGQYLAGSNIGGGALSPLYQVGGPRSIQLALKFSF